jgi:hypothetical protein
MIIMLTRRSIERTLVIATLGCVVAVVAAAAGADVVGAAPKAKPTAATPAIAEARRLFERYVALEQAFDPAAADLYADDAVIQNKRKYPDGQVKTMSMPAKQYKALIRSAMPAAKARNDRSKYTDVRYAAEGAGVRITAQRFSELKKYTSPLSLLVKPDARGAWLIHEELSESQP